MIYANWLTPNPDPAPAAPPSRAASPVYTGKRVTKTCGPVELLAEMRRLHPGKTIYCHPDFLSAVGDAEDLAVLRGAQPGELFVETEGAR